MASVASQLIEEVTAHAQSDSLEDAREICADGAYFPNNIRIKAQHICPLSAFVCFVFIVLCFIHKANDICIPTEH